MVLLLAAGLLLRKEWFDALERFVGQLVPSRARGL